MSEFENKNAVVSKNGYTFSNVTIFVMALLIAISGLVLFSILLNIGFIGVLASTVCAVLMGLATLCFVRKRFGWVKAFFVSLVILGVIAWGYYLIVCLDWLKYFNDQEALQELIKQTGVWGYGVYVLIQFLQVTFLPLPAALTTIVGANLFGAGLATVLSIIGIMLGSIVAFVIGDKCGEKVVAWIVGYKNMKKYSAMLNDKGKYMFFLMLLFPVFPDDVLCLIAGMTTMSYRFFLITLLLTRPLGIFVTCYLGSGQIIPYHGWGLLVWAIIILFMIFAFWCIYRYQDKLEAFLMQTVDKVKFKLENFAAKFSKQYATKLLLRRNRVTTLLLPYTIPKESTEIKANKRKASRKQMRKVRLKNIKSNRKDKKQKNKILSQNYISNKPVFAR